MNKLVMLTLCLGMVCMLVADTALPTNAVPIEEVEESGAPRRAPKSRALLYSQIPGSSANAIACQLDLVYPFEADLVEDVTPDDNWAVDSFVGYVRCWNGFASWSLVDEVRVLVYPDSSIGSHPCDSPDVEIIVPQGGFETAAYGAGWYVGVPLSTPINLDNGILYWLELQPVFSFSANGQTGTMSDPGIGNGQEFFYRFPLLGVPRFQAASAGGWPGLEGGLELWGGIQGVNEMPDEIDAFSFKVTSPNPVSSRASFAFTMPHHGDVTFTIYNVSGQKVYSYDSNIPQGEHTIVWDLKDNARRDVVSGIYLYRMETGTYHAEGKLVVIR